MQREREAAAAGRQLPLADAEAVKGQGAAVAPPGRTLDGGRAAVSLPESAGSTEPAERPAASEFFPFSEWDEIGNFLHAGQWLTVPSWSERVLHFTRGFIVAEIYPDVEPGWVGCVRWTARNGVPFRYSHYLRTERISEMKAELNMILTEVLARAGLSLAGEGGA